MSSHSGPRKEPSASELAGATDRVASAWQAWLQALASDAEAALGAALMYEALDAPGRNAFLDVLELDAAGVDVPKVAIFAPLLSVERNASRRERIERAMGDELDREVQVRPIALIGTAPNGERVAMVATPVYLDFMRVTVCRFSVETGITWVRDEPLVNKTDVRSSDWFVDQVELERVPLCVVVDEVARAIVTHRRRAGMLPETLRPLLDLFGARFNVSERGGLP
ncbi:MAG: hypothetical protein MUF54_05510 [Polyangiaceae bacterium]|jgi:hypothetical protein|nr:hypothetical protein [Polyangiaceae bacterium]